MRVGIFGGTFDPVHLGHIRAAEEFAQALDLGRVLMVPVLDPPHREPPEAEPEARLEMLRLALAGNARLEPSGLELDREGPSYTLNTIRRVKSETGGDAPYIALGADVYREISCWHRPDDVMNEAHIVVMTRPGSRPSIFEAMPEDSRDEYVREGDIYRRRSGTTLRMLDVTGLDISSSRIRDYIREGKSIRYLVPETVFEYIHQNKLYTGRMTVNGVRKGI